MARDTTPDKIQLQVVIDGSPARKELAELRQATAKLRDEQKGLIEQQRQLSDQRKAAAAKGDVAEVQRIIQAEKALRAERDLQIASMKELQAKQQELRASMDPLEMSLTELRTKAQELRSAWSAGLGSPEDLAKIGNELQLVEQRMQALGTQQGRALMLWEQERQKIDLNRMSLEQLALEEKRWQLLRNSREGNSAEYREAEEGLRQVKERQDELTNAKRRGLEMWEEERKGIALTDMTLEQLEKEYARAAQIREQAKPGMEYDKAAADLDNVRQRQEQLTNAKQRAVDAWEEERKAIALTDMTLEQLELEYKRAEAIRDQAKPGGEYDKANADLLAVKDRVEQMTNANRQAADQWKVLRQSMRLEDMSIEQLKLEKQYLEELRGTIPRATAEFDKLGKELEQLDKELADVRTGARAQEREWDEMRKTLRLTDMTMEQLEMETKRLNAVLRTTDPNTAQWAMYRKELTAVEARTKTLTSGLGPFGRMWQEIRGNVLSAGAVLGGMFAGQAIFTGIGNMVRSSAELSDAISDVKKTTGLSTPVVRELASELSKIDTRTSRAELLALARDAGKLGISAKNDVLEFVRAGNQINVALGEDLGQDAIKNIGKLVDLFSLRKQFGLEESMLKVGSTLNELGMASTAAEGYMVEFLRRMGGIAPLAGITIDQTLALGATLDSLGQTSEVSSTALSKMFVQMAGSAAKYAGIAGMELEEFKRLMKENALEAFIAVLEGSKKTEGGIIALTETLGDLGVDGSRAAGVFGVLSNNTERLREQMGIANEAFREGSSVTTEYEEKNNNLAATLEKLSKEFNRLIANGAVIDFFSRLAVTAREAIDWIERNATVLSILGKVLLNTVVAWGSYKVATALAGKASIIATAATNALATAKGVLTGKISLATAGMKAFNAVSKLNVFGLLISGLTTVISLWGSFSDSMKEAASQLGQETTKLQLLHAQLLVTNADTKERKKLIEELKTAYPDYLANLDSDKVTNEELGEAMKFVNQQLINKSVLQAKDQQLEEQNARAVEKKLELLERERNLRQLLVTLSEKSGVKLKDSNNILEQALAFQREASVSAIGGFAASDLEGQIRGIKAFEQSYRDEVAKSEALLKDRQETARGLASETQFVTEAQKAQTAATQGTVEENLVQLRTLQLINEEIQSLESQKANTTNREAYQTIEAKIKALEAERDAITGGNQKTKTAKAIDDLSQLEAAYRATIERLSLDQQDADAKELLALDLKHAEEIKKVREQQDALVKAKKLAPEQAQTDLRAFGDNQAKERQDLINAQLQRQWDAAREANERIAKMLGEARNTELEKEMAYLDEQIAVRQSKNQDVLALEQERARVLMLIYERNARGMILQEAEKWDEVINEAREAMLKYEETMAANGLDPTEEELATLKSHHDKILELERAKSIAIEQVNKERRQKERAAQRQETMAERLEYARRIQNVAEWANAMGSAIQGVMQIRDVNVNIAEQQADADGVRTEQEIAMIERLKQKRRAAALAHIAVQAAAAVASAVASALASTIPFPGNLLAAAPAVGTVLGLIAQARALLNEGSSTEQISTTGGRPPRPSINAVPEGAKGGILDGPSHANGGLGVFDPEGRQVAELEGGEAYAVLSKPFVEKNADLLPSLFQASREGTRFKPFERDLVMPNPKSVQRAMQVVHMARGGVLGDDALAQTVGSRSRNARGTALVNMPTGPDDNSMDLLAMMQKMVEETTATRKAAEQWPTKITATTSIIEGERRKDEYDYIQRLNQGRRA